MEGCGLICSDGMMSARVFDYGMNMGTLLYRYRNVDRGATEVGNC